MDGDSRQPPPSNPQLTSWKAIAQFFDRDVRTVQRWEKDEGLPVRRHLHRRKNSVYADPEELRAWWAQQGTSLEPPADATPPAPSPASAPSPAAAPTGIAPSRRPVARRSFYALAGLLVVAVAAGLWTLWRPASDGRTDGARVLTIGGRPPDSSPSVGPLGDFNGDGQQDVVVSTHQAGHAFIVFGGRPRAEKPLASLADVEIKVRPGHSLMPVQAGDFNGDAVDDILVSEILTESESLSGNGPSYLIWGRRDWPRALALPAAASVTLDVRFPTTAGMFGCIFGPGADLNGDGFQDVVLGGVDYGTKDRRSAGGALIFYGRRDWPATIDAIAGADVEIAGAETGEALGAACATGDFNGDGTADLGIVAMEHTLWNLRGSRGRVYIFHGRRSWPRHLDARTAYDLRIDGQQPNLRLGRARLADVSGDGLADLILPRATASEGHAGEVRLFFGGSRRGIVTEDAADVLIEGTKPGAKFGYGIGTSDLDGNGLLDLLVSEPGAGTLHAFYGRRDWRPRGTPDEHGAVPLTAERPGIGAWNIEAWSNLLHTPPAFVLAPDLTVPGVGADVAAWVVDPQRPVKLDVRPEHDENVILPNWVCVVRVFGFSRAAGDAIDPATLRLAGAPPTQTVTGDYNGDGFTDVQAMFDTGAMRLDPKVRTLWIRGRTRGGLPIAGADSVVVQANAAKR